MVEVILKKEVRKLGDRGSVVRVAPGYARNYLIPQGLAIPATSANKQQVEEMQAAGAREADRLTAEANTTAESLDGAVIRLVRAAGERGQLFGSVTNRDIAAALVEAGHQVDRHQVVLGSPLKRVADFDVRIHLYRDVNVTIKVEVRAEGREDELFLDMQDGPSEMEKFLLAESEAPAEGEEAAEGEAAEGEAAVAAEGGAEAAVEGEETASEEAAESAEEAASEEDK